MALTTDEKLERRLARYAEAVALVDAGEARPKVAEAVALLREGVPPSEIGVRMGLSKSMGYQLLNDPTDERNRARKARYAGTCRDCGAPTNNSGSTPPERCNACYRSQNAERDAEILRLWGEGLSAREITRRLGLSPAAVRGCVQTARNRKGLDVPLHRARNRENWPAIERLAAEGLSAREISEQIGCSPESVRGQARHMRDNGIEVRFQPQTRRTDADS